MKINVNGIEIETERHREDDFKELEELKNKFIKDDLKEKEKARFQALLAFVKFN